MKIKLITLILGMAVLGACVSGPKPFENVDPLMPDAQSVVVYFRASADVSTGSIWDGDKPIGDFDTKGLPLVPIVVYKTTPGEHYFIAHASNWIVMRARLDPNKRYYVGISSAPSPPFTKFISMYPMDANDIDDAVASRWSQTLEFKDEWRAAFAQGELLKEVQENLKEAKSKQMEINLSGKDGI